MVGGDDGHAGDGPGRPSSPSPACIVHVGGPGMGQVVKLCNNLIYAAQMLATAEATALALTSGVDMAKLHEVLVHATGDCVAVRTRLPVAGVVPDSPASNGWRPGFMTDLMAKDLDLALAYGGPGRGAPGHHGHRPPGPHRGDCRRVRPRGLLRAGQGGLLALSGLEWTRRAVTAAAGDDRPERAGCWCWRPTTAPGG